MKGTNRVKKIGLGSEMPLTVTVSVPAEFASKLRQMLNELEVPETFLKEYVQELFVNDCTLDKGNWFGAYVYPNRETAERVVRRLIQEGSHALAHNVHETLGGFRYRVEGRTENLDIGFPSLESVH